MKIFLDTASVDEIKKANDIIPLDGVTTNPTLIMKEGKDYVQTLKEIAKIGLDIELHYKKPQDIEFAVKDKEIYILQSRAITTL